jgi:hypothetical protein
MNDRNRRPRLHVITETRGPNSDPHFGESVWDREWTPGEHGGFAFSTETARVDVVDPQPTRHLRIFAGGSRTIGDRGVIDAKIKALPRRAVILTSRTHGASAGIRDAAMRRGLRLEVWTAMTDRYATDEAAYFARDEEMIRSADRVLAFWDGESTGTAHELSYARSLSKPVDLVLVNRGPSLDRYPGGDAA